MEEDKSPLVKILLILFVVTTVLIGAAYLFSLRSNIQIPRLLPSKSATVEPKKDLGYNFEVPTEIEVVSTSTATTPEPEIAGVQTGTPVSEGVEDELLTPEMKEFAFNYQIEEGQIGSINIPNIGVNAPILKGNDGDKLLDQGFWHYPSTNMPGQGESILLCHRRHFGQNDPRTCWDLNLLKQGDFIQINDNNGKPIRFIVKSVTIKTPDDLNIYQLSNENYLKIITCSLEDGRAGGSSHRVVIVAEKVK